MRRLRAYTRPSAVSVVWDIDVWRIDVRMHNKVIFTAMFDRRKCTLEFMHRGLYGTIYAQYEHDNTRLHIVNFNYQKISFKNAVMSYRRCRSTTARKCATAPHHRVSAAVPAAGAGPIC